MQVLAAIGGLLGLFGGAAAIAAAIAAYLSKLFADRSIEAKKGEITLTVESAKATFAKDLEDHKARISEQLEDHRAKLKRDELFFNKQVDVAKAFVALRHSLQPDYRPEMDWDEAVEDLASRLGAVERQLNAFRLEYYHLLPKAVRDQVDHLTTRSMQEKFGDFHSGAVTAEARTAGAEVLEGLQKIEETLIETLRT